MKVGGHSSTSFAMIIFLTFVPAYWSRHSTSSFLAKSRIWPKWTMALERVTSGFWGPPLVRYRQNRRNFSSTCLFTFVAKLSCRLVSLPEEPLFFRPKSDKNKWS